MSGRSDKSLENGMALSKNSESMSENDNREKITSDKTNTRVDVNPDIIENILLDIEPIKILESSTELETFKNLHEDFEDKRSDGKPEDRYYYQESDRKHPNDVESLYEELKNVYDWSDGELKNGLRLRGDQRLRYESDDKIDTNSSQLQPLDDRFSSSQNDDAQRYHSSDASWMTMSSISTPASDYFALKVMNDMLKGGLEQNNSAEENLPNAVSSITIQSRIPQAHIAEEKKNPSLQENTIQRSATNTDSGSPYENREYIESKKREMLKRNLNSRNQAVISSQDLHESFVESLDWHDDFDDNVKVRFGRGLKAINDVVILDANKTHDQVNGSDIVNEISVNSYLHDSPQTFRENSSILQGCYDNATANLMDIFNIRDTNNDEDLEVAEQKYINHRMPRVKRAVASYRVFYDDMSQNQRDFDEADESLSSHSQLPNILENQPDGTYGERDPNWSNNMRDLNRYSRIPQKSKKKKKPRKKDKKNKHTTEKHRKSGSRSSSDRDRRHHAHRSDVSSIASGDKWKKSKKKNKAHSKSALTGRGSIQKSKTAERELLRAAVVNEAPGGRMLYENAEDRSTVKPEENDARRKEITLLLAADNVDDESQTDMALHGELAGKIVEQIFERVQKNDQLKSIFGPGLQKNYKTEEVTVATNIYRQGLNETGTNHSETMMKRVMELLDRLILNEVQRKTCVSVSPDMREFLGWMLGVNQEEELLEEVPPLPLVHEEITPEQKSGQKFLFDNTFEQAEKENINDLQKKVRVIETLVKEYNALTAKEKTEVQTVYDYLIRQLNQLLQYIEARETTEMKGKLASMSTGAAKVGIGSILQYQNAMPNAINTTNSVTKNASFLPIDMHNLFRSNNTSLKMADRQLYYSHVAPRHRETRSLDKVSLKKHRKMKRQETHNRGRNKNRKSMQKYRKHQDRAGSSHRKSRRKRADLEKNDRDSFYLGYETPTIYDSFKLLDAKLTEKKRKRKRELADKGSVAVENDRTLDSLPIKGRNRLEDEVILLNKREAWKRENEEQLEEVAFGKDMRNNTRRERERFEKLTGGDKRKPIDEISSRTKREDVIRETSIIRSVDRSNNFHGTSEIGNGESGKNSTSKEDNVVSSEDRLRLVERRINVFVDNNKTDAAIDTVVAEVSTGGKLAINAAADNQVKGKLHAINCETKIDKTNRSASFVNLTSGTEPRVSKERPKVPEAERQADDNAVKLNRATNYRSEEMDPEVELKNLRQRRENGIYSVADWKTNDLFYGDDNLPRNKLRGKYVANLDEPDDLDTGPENNLAILRLKSKKRSNDVVEWKLVPLIRRSPYRDAGASSRIYLIEKRLPALSNNRSVKIDLYSSSPELWRQKHRRRRNGAFNISPVLRTIDDEDSFSLGIPPETKRVIEIAGLKDLRVDPKTLLKRSRKLSRLRNNKRWNDDRVAEFRVPSAWKDLNRKLRNLPRSRNDAELGDRAIYDDAVGLRLPV